MRLSCKAEYGLRALFDLAQHYGEGPIQSSDIAKRQSISENYLNQMLIILRRAGLLSSTRGPQGGHQLARAPHEITLLEAFKALEGEVLPLTDTPSNGNPRTLDIVLVHDALDDLRTLIEGYLGKITLEELCQRKRQREGQLMYYI